MNLKQMILIFTLFMVLLCGVSAISAAPDGAIDNNLSEIDSGSDLVSVSDDEKAAGVDEDSALNAQENKIIGQSLTSDSGLLNQIDDSNLDKIGLYNINDVESNSISNEEYLKSSSDEVIINPNFDDGLDNWTSSGTVQVQTGQEGNGIYMKSNRGTSAFISQSVDLSNVDSIGFYYKAINLGTSSSFIVSAGDVSNSLDLSVGDWTYGELDTSSVSGLTDLKFTLNEAGSKPAVILIDTIAAHTNVFVLTVDFISNVTTGIDQLEVQFNATSNGNVIKWLWDFGDGETAEGQNITHKYSKIGSYDVTLKTWYADNPNSTITKNNHINVYHTIPLMINPDFENATIQKTTDYYNATDDTYLVTRYFDGWIVTGDQVVPINYNIPQVPNKTAKSGNYFLTVQPSSTSIRPIQELGWRQYSTGIPSLSQNLDFDYINSVSFYVMLVSTASTTLNVSVGDVYSEEVTITNSSGDLIWQLVTIDTSDKSIFNGIQSFKISDLGSRIFIDDFSYTLSNLTHSNFSYSVDSVTNKYFNIQFNNKAYGFITSFFWDFGDGTNSTEIDPMHSFKPGTYNVKLTASNVNHTDEYSYTLVLEDFPTIGNIIYKSIQDAIDNADDGDVIDITKDLSENIIIDKNLTLNFNGNKLIGTGSSPVVQVTGGAQATIKNIAFEDSAVISTDDESSLTISESNIVDANITLSAGNIALDGNDFTDSFITITNANAIIANNNVTNAGIKVNGGKSKINNNILSSNDVAIAQTAGETDIISNLITNNAVGVNITGGSANVNFNALYENTNVSLAYVGSVNSSNNWYGALIPNSKEGVVDIIAPDVETQPWLIITLNCDVSELYTTQNYTITADLTINSNMDNTSALGKLPAFVLPISTEAGESSAFVNVVGGIGEFTLTTGNLAFDDVTFTVKGDEYPLDAEIVANVIDTTLIIESVENGVVIVTLKDVDGNVISDADVTYTVKSGNQITDKTVDGKITITGLKGTVTIAAEYAGVTDYPYYNSTTASESFNFAYDGNINITIPESAKTTETPSITFQLPTDAQGTVNIFVDAKKVNTTTITGTTTIPLSDLGAGEHVVEVKYSDDDIYLPAEKTGNLIVSKLTPTIAATGSSVGENETATVSVNIDGATGIVLVEVAGNKYFAELETGSATVNVVGLKVGNYTANIKYSGDEKYTDTTATADIKVSEVEDKTITELKAELAEAKENATQLFNNLTDANNRIENLTTQLNETQANATKLAEDLADANAKVENLTTKLNETQSNATKLAEDLADANSKVGDLTAELNETQVNATKLAEDLADANAKVGDLTSQLNETQANATKLADELKDANQKAENLTTQLGDAQKQIQTLSADLISTTVAANNLNIKALTNGNIQVTLKANGTALANKTVNIIINGITYNGTTGEDGVAKIAVKFASAGTYYATVTFAGDDTYKSSIGTSKVVVSKKATKITAPKKSFKAKVKTKKVKITLKSGSTVLKSKKITLKVNGKTYTAKTNSKGVATIKVTKLTKKGTFKYTVKFAGDKAYKAITKKGKITIK